MVIFIFITLIFKSVMFSIENFSLEVTVKLLFIFNTLIKNKSAPRCFIIIMVKHSAINDSASRSNLSDHTYVKGTFIPGFQEYQI